jgi:ligand-binding sensor domain-containing protein
MTRCFYLCLIVAGLLKAAGAAPQWIASVCDERNYAIASHGDNVWIQKKYGMVCMNTMTDKKSIYESAGLDISGNSKVIAIDTFGNPWAVTSTGIAWYNGASWQRFDAAGSPLEGKQLSTIFIDSKNRLWTGTTAWTIVLHDPGGWQVFDSATFGMTPYWINTIAEANDGKIWAGIGYGNVFVYDGKGWVHYTSKNAGLFTGIVTAIAAGDSSDMWIAQENGLSCYHNGKWYGYDMTNTALSSSNYLAVYMDSRKAVWAGTRDRIAKIDGSSWKIFPSSMAGRSLQNATGFAEDANHAVWCMTNYGDALVGYNGSAWADRTFGLGDVDPQRPEVLISGLPNFTVDDLFEDKEGALWVQTDYSYIIRIDKTGRAVWRVDSTPVFTSAHGIGQDASGALWVSKPLGGMAKFDGNKWDSLASPIAGIPRIGVNRMLSDKSGTLWIGCQEGLIRYDGVSWRLIDSSSAGDSLRSVGAIFQDQNGRLWISANTNQIYTYDGKTMSRIDIPPGLISFTIGGLAVTPDSTLWVGSASGAFTRKRNAWQKVVGLPQDYVTSLTVDKDNGVWFGMIDSGAVRWDGKTWTRFYSKRYWDGNRVSALLCDRNNNVWMGYLSLGLSVYNKDGIAWTEYTGAARYAPPRDNPPAGITRVVRSGAGCEIRYRQHNAGPSAITVYSLSGERIATFRESHQRGGEFSFVWPSGETRQGVSSGIYLVSIRTDAETFSVPVHVCRR